MAEVPGKDGAGILASSSSGRWITSANAKNGRGEGRVRYRIPAELRERSVASLPLSTALRNALLFNNVRALGQLDGVDEERLLKFRQFGPKKVSELAAYLKKAVSAMPGSHVTNLGTKSIVQAETTTSADAVSDRSPSGLEVPGHLRGYRIESLSTWPTITETLLRHGITIIGQLRGITPADAASLGLSQVALSALKDSINQLASADWSLIGPLTQKGANGTPCLPRLPIKTLLSLGRADTVETEILALVEDLNDRDAALVLRRWGFKQWPTPTLEDLGKDFGITRERVRQVLQRVEVRLRNSGVRLSRGFRAAGLLNAAGGVLSQRVLLARMAVAGSPATVAALRVLSSLGPLGVVEPIQYESGFWFTEVGRKRLFGSTDAPGLLGQLRTSAGKALRSYGAIPLMNLIGETDLDPDTAAQIVAPQSTSVLQVSDYAIPIPVRGSRLVREARKLLAVSREVTIKDFQIGLGRHKRIGVAIPPPEVLSAVLSRHNEFIVERGLLRARKPLRPKYVLSPAELTGLHIIERHGGVVLWNEFVDDLIAAGFSQPTAHVVLHSVFVRTPATGIYALRGRPLAANLVAARRRARRAARANGGGVIDVRATDNGMIVRYRLSRFSLAGVLSTPRQIENRAPLWSARFPDGSTTQVKMSNGLIWPFYQWLKRIGAKEGDVIIATFREVENTIELEHVPGGLETHDNDC